MEILLLDAKSRYIIKVGVAIYIKVNAAKTQISTGNSRWGTFHDFATKNFHRKLNLEPEFE